MKRTFSLLAVLATTLSVPLAAPVAAQDISSILNPGNFAARLNSGSPAMANMPSNMSGFFQGANPAARLSATPNAAPNAALRTQIAALAPQAVETPRAEIRSLAPLTSMVPTPRGGIDRVVVPTVAAVAVPTVTPAQGSDLMAMMADAAEAAPEGSNTLVINGGSNSAVIQSSPDVVTGTAEAPRRSLWQRMFGL